MDSNNFQFHGDKILLRRASMINSSSESMVFPEAEVEVSEAVVELSYFSPKKSKSFYGNIFVAVLHSVNFI